MTTLNIPEGYLALSPLYAILCMLLLEYRRDLRPEPREHVARVLGARESGACARDSSPNHRCAGRVSSYMRRPSDRRVRN